MGAAGLTPALDLTLPEALEAHEPPEARGLTRDGVRMLVSFTDSDRLVHARFTDLPDFLRPGDLVVLNVSATLPAALTAQNADGSEVTLHISTRLPAGLSVVEFREAIVSEGDKFVLDGGGRATALMPYPGSTRLWVTRLELPQSLYTYLERWGRPITYRYLRGSWPLEMYQNVYAAVPGSAEMPSAGRPFTPNMLDRLTEQGVYFASVLLHAGVSSIERHELPAEEYFEVSHETAAALERARKGNHRAIAVGTSVVRALESSVDEVGRPIASRGWTDLAIGSGRGMTIVDGLLTGFHESKASHLDLVMALTGLPRFERAYRAALEAGYLWHEFGDVHLILSERAEHSIPGSEPDWRASKWDHGSSEMNIGPEGG
jgi:S-adenosylmethionine:tRNA ribosyltransferase-isomerase